MNTNPLHGDLVRLVAMDPERDAPLYARWNNDSEYLHLADGDPALLWGTVQMKKWIEEEGDSPNAYGFMIYPLEGDQPIGGIGLDGINWITGDAWIGIGIGERAYWSKGYGTDAMRVLLRYAFEQLNLRRVTLNVFAFNERGVRSYEKCGFKHEGRVRQWMKRAGKRYDLIHMGILRREWEALNTERKAAAGQPAVAQPASSSGDGRERAPA